MAKQAGAKQVGRLKHWLSAAGDHSHTRHTAHLTDRLRADIGLEPPKSENSGLALALALIRERQSRERHGR